MGPRAASALLEGLELAEEEEEEVNGVTPVSFLRPDRRAATIEFGAASRTPAPVGEGRQKTRFAGAPMRTASASWYRSFMATVSRKVMKSRETGTR